MIKNILLMLLLMLAVPLRAESVFRPFTADYVVHYNGFKIGEMRQRFERAENSTWLLETKMKTTGLVSLFKDDTVVERSEVMLKNDRIYPLSYSYQYSGSEKDVVERLTFDWNKNKLTALRDGKTKKLPLTVPTYDKLSYQLVIRRELFGDKKQFHYKVADRDKIEQYDLEVLNEESLVTTMGELDTLVVKRGTTKLWLAKDYDFLVVQIEKNEDGNIATSYIISKDPFAIASIATPAAR